MVAKARHIDYNRIIVGVQFIYSLQKFFIYNYSNMLATESNHFNRFLFLPSLLKISAICNSFLVG